MLNGAALIAQLQRGNKLLMYREREEVGQEENRNIL